jgi:sulfopyruvate decarboxylase subunit beta
VIRVSELFARFESRRDGAIVIPCQTARQPWFDVSREPDLDVHFRGCMGKGSSLGLGLAMARPERPVWVFDGDGSLLMNLGTMATIVTQAPPNYSLFVLENGVYAGTGGQPVPARDKLSFEGMARAAGFERTFTADTVQQVDQNLDAWLQWTGPVFGAFRTEIVPGGNRLRDQLPHLWDCLGRLRSRLAHPPAS